MKKMVTFVLIIAIVIATSGSNFIPVNLPLLGIKITFSSKAYWDGTQCAPRDKGCCLHIEAGPTPEPGNIIGEISYSDQKGISLAISKKDGLSPAMFNELFKQGKFFLDGDATFQPEVLVKLGLKAGFQIAAGYYPYSIKDDLIVITFK
jgi:hypothetical protein